MVTLYSQEEFGAATSRQLLPLQCSACHQTYLCPKNRICVKIKGGVLKNHCLDICKSKNRKSGQHYNCSQCGKEFWRAPNDAQTKNLFCSKSCAGIYNNTHKTHGTRRSKLEQYLESSLISLYPNLEFHFNRKDAINSELDIYIPSLKLAFELNGIFHYEPIFGADKLDKIQNNDNRKFQACLERGIELCIIDTSKLSYFKEHTAKPFLTIITNIIKTKII